MTTIADIIHGAIPDASPDLCEHILWSMTPYPCGAITAKSLYRAASRFKRAKENGIRLCDWCDNQAQEHKYLCQKCESGLDRCREASELNERI